MSQMTGAGKVSGSIELTHFMPGAVEQRICHGGKTLPERRKPRQNRAGDRLLFFSARAHSSSA
jgi:hypothetical protein